jgi:cytochrome c biogenesis protein CcmG/thiol:disulfide interchange protein DsbE
MTRTHWAALALIVLATVLAVAYSFRPAGHKKAPASVKPDVKALQVAAALEPCPSGLGPAFPGKAFDCLGGGAYVYAAHAGTGKPTLVNIYGSWCGPCLKEMPILRRFHAAAGDRVPVVGIDSTDSFDNALRFAKDVGQTWPALFDDNHDVGSHLKLLNVPATLFLDSTGRIVHVQHGPFASDAQLAAMTKRYLGVSV